MTIVDQYIADNETLMSDREMALRLGLSCEYVKVRRKRQMWTPPFIAISPQDEIYALLQFIQKRKTGLLVDIAKRRIIDINKTLNY